MPFCPNCRDEYRPGFTVCTDCGVPLVAELPSEPRDEAGSEWEAVASARDLYEGELMALRLREAGIEAKVMDRSFHQFPSNAPQSTVIDVLVPANRTEEARRILAAPAGLPEDADAFGEGEPVVDREVTPGPSPKAPDEAARFKRPFE